MLSDFFYEKKMLYLQEPGRETRVPYSSSGEDKYDEGIVQTSKVKTSSYDASQKYIYISMWAVNKVLTYM
jgi:hypothetical protein